MEKHEFEKKQSDIRAILIQQIEDVVKGDLGTIDQRTRTAKKLTNLYNSLDRGY